jgi:hypothetical protein
MCRFPTWDLVRERSGLTKEELYDIQHRGQIVFNVTFIPSYIHKDSQDDNPLSKTFKLYHKMKFNLNHKGEYEVVLVTSYKPDAETTKYTSITYRGPRVLLLLQSLINLLPTLDDLIDPIKENNPKISTLNAIQMLCILKGTQSIYLGGYLRKNLQPYEHRF